MNRSQDWKTWVRAAVIVGQAALIALTAILLPETTAAADPISYMEPAWATDGSTLSQDALDALRAPIPAAALGSRARFETCLPAAERTYAEPSAPLGDREDDFIHWEVHQEATGTTEYRGLYLDFIHFDVNRRTG